MFPPEAQSAVSVTARAGKKMVKDQHLVQQGRTLMSEIF